jgi:hypothetical protein
VPWITASLLGVFLSDALASPKGRSLNRSIYVPIEFALCEHVERAVFYQDELAVSTMPVRRIFQFTYYPDLEQLLPEVIDIRIEGRYVEDEEPFAARLAATADGIYTARGSRSLGTEEQMRKQHHKLDVRVAPRKLRLQCPRHCWKSQKLSSTEDHSGHDR